MKAKDWECIYHHKNMCGRGPMCLCGESLDQCSSECKSNKTFKEHREDLKKMREQFNEGGK